MAARWLSNSGDVPRRATVALEGALRSLAQPARARRLRQALQFLFALWGVLALSQLIWALWPGRDEPLPAGAVVINPVNLPAPTDKAAPVDIPRVQAWHLFGEAGAVTPTGPAAEAEETAGAGGASARAGIEKGARETSLDLKLRGVVASSEDGLGYAIIEHQSQQDIYAVDDKLPVSGQGVLAKVMPRRVVLDNGGTYELLELFEESGLDSQLEMRRAPEQASPAPPQAESSVPADADASALARAYRERLYQNPQSLADVVTVSAVRENGELQGYRIAPGKESEQFARLGFKPGDLVTSVNGIALDDPANTLRLYQTMRTASEAVFDLRRDEQQLTVSVQLGEGPAGQ